MSPVVVKYTTHLRIFVNSIGSVCGLCLETGYDYLSTHHAKAGRCEFKYWITLTSLLNDKVFCYY